MRNLSLFCLIVLIATLSACGGTGKVYSLRDRGEGLGWVFYVDPDNAKLLPEGKKYLEVTSFDQSPAVGIAWGEGAATGSIATAVGTGQANTDKIIATKGAGTYAARLCRDLVSGGFSDWFLPSKDELNKIYINLQKGVDENGVAYPPAGVGTFTNDYYWSSTEINSELALEQVIDSSDVDHAPFDNFKQATASVRCVRAF
ncbi:MAG: hypothetical protein WCQ53_08735 [bacterium]